MSASRIDGPIGILGAGAVGSVLAGLLARTGAEVVAVGRPEHVEAIRAGGLRLSLPAGETVRIPLAASDEPAALRDSPAVLLCVKSQDTEAALAALRPYMRPDALVFSLQNGVRNVEVAERVLGRGRAVGVVVLFNAVYLVPGEVALSGKARLVVGKNEAQSPHYGPTLAALRRAGVSVRVARSIAREQWLKLVLNSGNTIDALTGAGTLAVYTDPVLREILVAAALEALGVLRRAGVRLGLRGVLMRGAVRLYGRLPAGWLRRAAARRLREGARSSTLQSVLRGRRTEVDYLAGEIVRIAAARGEGAPVNARLVELVHRLEAAGEEPRWRPAALREEVLGGRVSRPPAC